MSFIDIARETEGRQEEHSVPGGETELRITRGRVYDNRALIISYEVTSDPYAKEISDFINFPSEGRTPKEVNRLKNRMGDWKETFGIEGLDVDDQDGSITNIDGKEGWAILKDPVDDDKGYGSQNKISRYIPRR